MKARDGGAARRYARAAFELARERGQAAEVRQALDLAATEVEGHRELRLLLLNPALSGEKKKALAAALWPARDGAAGLAARLLVLLAERHRVDLLARVARVFGELWNAERQVLSAEIESAVPLDEGQLAGLRGAVQRTTGHDVEFQAAVDERLLGGLRLTMDGRVYDGSVRAQLAALRAHLLEGGESA